MATPSVNNTAFGRGSILFNRYDANGVKNGQFIHMGNCDSIATSVTRDTVTMTDYTTNTSAPYNSATKATTVTLKISGFEIDKNVLAMVQSGDTTSLVQTSTNIVGETLAAATLVNLKGSFFRALKRNVTTPTLLQGTATMVSGTDWELYNSYDGIFRIFSGGGIVDGTVLTTNYTAPAVTAPGLDVVRMFNTAQINGQLVYLPNNTTGPNWEMTLWNVTLGPSGDFSLISDDWIKWNMEGTVLSDSAGAYGGSAANPYGQLVKRS